MNQGTQVGTDVLRVAVCQIECHPAFVSQNIDFEAEPILPADASVSLTRVASRHIDLSKQQQACREQYLTWQEQRLRGVFDWLGNLRPVPEIVVLPEGSVPLSLVYHAKEFADKHDSVVFAGTHRLRLSKDARKLYRQYGCRRRELDEWKLSGIVAASVLPIAMQGKLLFHLKRTPSVFETTEFDRLGRTHTSVAPFLIKFRDRELNVLTLVCSEALQPLTSSGDYDLLIIPSYNPKGVSHFESVINTHINNQIPVMYANDGKYGDSGVFLKIHNETDNWWWGDVIKGRMPIGDAVLVVDIDMKNLAPSVGVTNPSQGAHLAKLAAVVCARNDPQSLDVVQSLNQAREHEDTVAQKLILESLVQSPTATRTQHCKCAKLHDLASRDILSPAIWESLGEDCVVDSISPLAFLETELVNQTSVVIDRILEDSTTDDEGFENDLFKLTRIFKKRGMRKERQEELPSFGPPKPTTPAIDRDEDARIIREFLHHSTETVLLLSGLEQVGKSTVIDLALFYSGRSKIIGITLTAETTLEFIAKTLILACQPLMAEHNELGSLSDQMQIVENSMPQGAVVIIERAGSLRTREFWRDKQTPEFFEQLIEALNKNRGKLILETRIQFDLGRTHPQLVRRRSVRGLPENARLAFLDYHLSRTDLDPKHFGRNDRQQFADDLDGHPGAIILASELAHQEGFGAVSSDLRKRGGFHTDIVRRIVQGLHLASSERDVIGVLSLARYPVRPGMLSTAFGKDVIPTVRSLLDKSIVERSTDDSVVLTPLMRGFSDIEVPPEEVTEVFHSEAARYFAKQASLGQSPYHMRCGVESGYHARLAGKPELAHPLGTLVDSTLAFANDLISRHEYRKAEPVVAELISQRPNAETYHLGALVYSRLGKVEQAWPLAKLAFAEDPNRIWILTEVGRKAINARRDDIAREVVNFALSQGVDSDYVAVLEGLLARRDNDYEREIECFRRAVSISEAQTHHRSAWGHLYLGRSLLRLGNVDEAIEVLHRGEVVEGESRRRNRALAVLLRVELCFAYLCVGDITNAQRFYDLVDGMGRDHSSVILLRLLMKATTGDPNLAYTALADLDPTRSRDPAQRCTVYLYRALVFQKLTHVAQAATEYSHAHEADAGNVFVLLRWTECLIIIAREREKSGDPAEAREAAVKAKEILGKILEIAPANEEALRLMQSLDEEFHLS